MVEGFIQPGSITPNWLLVNLWNKNHYYTRQHKSIKKDHGNQRPRRKRPA